MTLPCWEGRFSLAERCDVDESAFSIEIRVIILLETALMRNAILSEQSLSSFGINVTSGILIV